MTRAEVKAAEKRYREKMQRLARRQDLAGEDKIPVVTTTEAVIEDAALQRPKRTYGDDH